MPNKYMLPPEEHKYSLHTRFDLTNVKRIELPRESDVVYIQFQCSKCHAHFNNGNASAMSLTGDKKDSTLQLQCQTPLCPGAGTAFVSKWFPIWKFTKKIKGNENVLLSVICTGCIVPLHVVQNRWQLHTREDGQGDTRACDQDDYVKLDGESVWSSARLEDQFFELEIQKIKGTSSRKRK